MSVITKRRLLTNDWTSNVADAEMAIARFDRDSDCQVVFFEIAGDRHLHVNVIHRNQTETESGWAGPGNLAEGFVHNRMFKPAQARGMVRHIRNMVFSAER